MTQQLKPHPPATLEWLPLIQLLVLVVTVTLIIRFNPFHWLPWGQMNPNQRMQMLMDIFIMTIGATRVAEATIRWYAGRRGTAH